MRFPRPLRPGDRIGVTSPSSGVAPRMRGRLDAALATLRDRGYDVVVGDCMAADRVVSAPKEQRAAELTAMLGDPAIRAVVPPWGGELAIDLLDQLDWEALAAAEPTWLVGFSDMSTVLLPVTTRLGLGVAARLEPDGHAVRAPDGLLHWTRRGRGDRAVHPAQPRPLPEPGLLRLRRRPGGLDDGAGRGRDRGRSSAGETLDVSGRLVGGCIETVAPLAGTPYGDVPAFGREHAERGPAGLPRGRRARRPTTSAGRCTGSGCAGWFEHANAILIGRTPAPGHDDLSQHDAVVDALGDARRADRAGHGDRPHAAVPAAGERRAGPGRGATATGARSPRPWREPSSRLESAVDVVLPVLGHPSAGSGGRLAAPGGSSGRPADRPPRARLGA